MTKWNFPWAPLFLGVWPLLLSAADLRRRAGPQDADYGNRDWGPELVHFQLGTERFQPDPLVR